MHRRQFLGSMLASSVATGLAICIPEGALAKTETAPPGRLRAGTAHRAAVTDFGADPTGVLDSTQAVRRAVASLAQTGARLVFPPGRYSFVAANEPVMVFRGFDGLEVFGNGAELAFTGGQTSGLPAGSAAQTQLLLIENCRNVEIHDVKVDWKRPPFSQGTVISADPRGFVVQVDPDFPVTGAEPLEGFAEYDATTGAPASNGLLIRGGVAAVRSAGHQQLRVEMAAPVAARPGMRLVLLHSVEGAPCLELRGCDMALLESVDLYAGPGAGALLQGCHDVSFDDFSVGCRRGGGRLASVCGPGARMLDCAGAVSIKRSQFSGMGGDGIVLHQSYWKIAARVDERTVLVTGAGGRPLAAWQLPQPGSILQISSGADLELRGEIGVADAQTTAEGARIAFREELSPAVLAGDLLCNALGQPRTTVDHCIFAGGQGRAITAHGRIHVTNTRFSQFAGPAMVFAADRAAMEGPTVGSVTVTDNTLSHCNQGQGPSRRGTITIGEAGASAARVNQGVTIQRNVFAEDGGPAIECSSVSWLTVENNTFGRTDALGAPGATPRAIVLRNVDQSFLDANQSTKPQQICLIGCTDKVQVAANGQLTEVRQG